MRAVTFLLALMLSCIGLAGCLDTSDSIDDNKSEVRTKEMTWDFTCLGPESGYSAEGICSSSISNSTVAYEEPTIAIAPFNTEIMAIGVNALGPSVGLNAPLGGVQVALFVSENGGAAWSQVNVPTISEDKGAGSADPGFVFDAQGRLHFTGISLGARTAAEANLAQHVYYSYSDDLGKTWSNAVFWDEQDDFDRNWVTLENEKVVISFHSWQRGASHFAISEDRGLTWQTTAPLDGCTTPSSPKKLGDRLVFVCTTEDGIDLYNLKLETLETTHIQSNVLGETRNYFAKLATFGDIGFAMAPWSETGYLTRDGGESWQQVLDMGHTQTKLGWDWFAFRWLEAGPEGTFHLLFEGGEGDQCNRTTLCPEGESKQGHNELHVVFDPLLDELQWRVISAPPGTERTDGAGPPGFFDDYHGLAFTDDWGVAVWSWESGIEVTRIAPQLVPSLP
jgi:hypothetical protein